MIAATLGRPDLLPFIEQMGTGTTASGRADFARTLAAAEPLLRDVRGQAASGGIEGIGAIEGWLPDSAVHGIDWVTGRRGAQTRQAFQQAVSAFRHAMAGVAVTPSEQANIDMITGGNYRDEDAFVRGLEFLVGTARSYGRPVGEIEAALRSTAADREAEELEMSGEAFGAREED